MADIKDLIGWQDPDVQVGSSPIAGAGVIAMRSINAGEPVFRFGGILLPSSSRFNYAQVERGTVVGIAEEVLLGELVGHPKDTSDFLNHSCSPNLGMTDAITLVAISEIDAGVELTVDYGYWETDESYVMNPECNCGSSVCRRRITGRDWREMDMSNSFAQWAAPFIRRRIETREKSK